jgi:hypothetical protein
MPKKSLRCLVEIDIRAVTSPGTWLVKRDDIYLSVTLFGQVRQTHLTSSIFPLLFHEKLKFDKVFYSAYEPSQVADCLEDELVRIDLIQLSELYSDGRILAWYESTARSFLYPYPTYTPAYGLHDREILMDRSLTFPGISPRMEFSTKTVIQETLTPLLEPWDLDEEVSRYNSGNRRSRSRSRTRSPSPLRANYGRSTVSSAYKSRSVSPELRSKLKDVSLNDDIDKNGNDIVPSGTVDDRPPFVVRKIDDDLIGRKPTPLTPILPRSRSRSPDRSQRKPTTYLKESYRARSTSPTRRNYGYSSSDKIETDGLDTSTGYQRPMSSLTYRSSLRDRYDKYPWTSTDLDLIRARIDRALRRNRSLERLDRLNSYRTYYRYWPYYYDSLEDLELELELSRRRRLLYL